MGTHQEKREPVLVTLGVRANGERVVLDLRLAGGESEQAWLETFRAMGARHRRSSVLALTDCNSVLAAAVWAFTGFLSSQGKALRTINALERINEEFHGPEPKLRSIAKRLYGSCSSACRVAVK